MSKQLQRKKQILYRVLYLLEEQSVGQAAESDQEFESFITDLYMTVSDRAVELEASAKSKL